MATVRAPFAALLEASGGIAAPSTATAGLRLALRAALEHGRTELTRSRSGYEEPVAVAFAQRAGELLAVLPLDAAFAADPSSAPLRAQTLALAALGALHDLCGATRPALGEHEGFLVLALPGTLGDEELEELAPLALQERLAGTSRLRAAGHGVPEGVLDPLGRREAIGDRHPLRLGAAVLAAGGDPVDPEARAAMAQARADDPDRPHEDPDPVRRIARRILQTLVGKKKWGAEHHTELAHAARGFAGNERALALRVAEALLAEGLLSEKPSVGQRHVFLEPGRKADIHALIEDGAEPPGLRLPRR